MEKSNHSSGDVEDYFCDPPNFEFKIFAGPPPKRLVESASLTKALGTRHSEKDKRKEQTGLYQPFEASNT